MFLKHCTLNFTAFILYNITFGKNEYTCDVEDGIYRVLLYFSNLNGTSLDNIPTVLCSNGVRGEVGNEYLQMVDQNESDLVNANSEALQLVPEREQQKVELLITDEATGKFFFFFFV